MSSHDWTHALSALGGTLLHFLWQGMLIALLLELWLLTTRSRTARERYGVRCIGLLAMLVAPVASFAWLWQQPVPQGLDAALAHATGIAVHSDAEPLQGAWMSWVCGLWAVGALLCALRLAGGLWQVQRLMSRQGGVALDSDWSARFTRLACGFGVRARARVVDCAQVAVPTVVGAFKPVVLLPARIFTGLSEEQIEALIAHELAHVARHDYLVNIVQSLVEVLLFYHPAVWWISRGIRVEREYCCDDHAVAVTLNGLSYARALTALESWRGAQLQLGISTLGGSFTHRILRLVGGESGRHAPLRPAHSLAVFLLLVSMGASTYGLASWTGPASSRDCDHCRHHDSGEVEEGPYQLHRTVIRTAETERGAIATEGPGREPEGILFIGYDLGAARDLASIEPGEDGALQALLIEVEEPDFPTRVRFLTTPEEDPGVIPVLAVTLTETAVLGGGAPELGLLGPLRLRTLGDDGGLEAEGLKRLESR